MNVNKVILVGRLTRDPEVRTTGSGQNVATVGLATSRVFTDKSGQRQEQAEFHNIVLWGRTAEIAGQYLTKGQLCCFEGRLQTRSYTGKDGIERRVTEIVAENMQMGPRPGGGGSNYQGGNAQGGGYQQRSAAPTNAAPAVAPATKPAPAKQEEEIPTINLDDEKGDEEIKIEDVPF